MNKAKVSETPVRILHIEDSPQDAEIIRERLIDSGLNMHLDWAANEHDFTTFLKAGGYDLILADYMFPTFNALKVLRIAQSLCPDLPFICVSGAIGEEKAVELLKQGATDYVLKDRMDKLPLSIKRALDEVKERTRRKQAEAALQKLQKLKSVGTLAGGIAHDFNNILMVLFGNISLAKDDLPISHPSYKLLEQAENTMQRASRLTQQLLTFAKGGLPIKDEVSLGELVEEVAHCELAGSPVKLVYRQAKDLLLALVDKGHIRQVFSNLSINAREAMPKGGHLYITLDNADAEEVATCGLRKGTYVKVTVRDEGTGIDPKHLDLIFDPYFTTKQTGSGLGLATVFSIINKHDGHISVISEVGKGAIFTIYLPAVKAQTKGESTTRVTKSVAPTKPANILIMDDEEMILALVSIMLTRRGFTVATATDGSEAIKLYKQAMDKGAPFDAVIMDLTIPGGIGGKEAIKVLRSIDPKVKAIVSSGYADDPVMANYAEYGFQGVAAKPYTQIKLEKVLQQVLK